MNAIAPLAPTTPPPIRRDASVLAIVPHYACEDWLATCLTSLVNQTRPLDGIVVVDDASASPPIDIVAEFPDVTLLTASSNVGPYRLVQQVIELTRYDAYLFQDADDWSAPDRLASLLEVAEATGAELVGSDYVMVQCDQASAWVQGFPHDVNAALSAAPTAHALQHPTSLVARGLVERLGGFATGMRFSGDAEFLRRAAHAGRVVNATRPLYFRRNRTDSLTTSSSTGHGSPARQAVLDALAERAWTNATAAERGEAPLLAPFSRRDPVELVHLSGPLLGQQRALDLAWPTASLNGHRAPALDAGRTPLFVVSATTSLPDAVVWSLGQHPQVAAVPGASWLTPLARGADAAHALAGHGSAVPNTGRTMSALETLGVARVDVLDAVAAMVDRIVDPDAASWVAALPADADDIAAAAALFPRANLLHVVRHVDDAGIEPATWLADMRTCLDAEQRFGPSRVTRIQYDDLVECPDEATRRCLELAGVEPDERCTWPLRSFAGTGPPPSDDLDPRSDVVREARALSTALCGPRPNPSPDDRRLAGPLAAAEVAPALSAPPAVLSAQDPRRAPSALLRAAVPAGAIVAVVSKGDDELVDIGHATGWHFPRLADGTWAGYHPGTSEDAVAHLADLQQHGARYFFVPSWAMWWLDHYRGFREHLEATGRIVAASPEGGLLLQLGTAPRDTERLDLLPLVPDEQRHAPYQALGRPERDAVVPAGRAPRATVLSGRPAARHGRPKVAVIAWCVNHNPLGRAYLLAEMLGRRYDVELLGAGFDHFGKGIWPPLRDAAVPIRAFPGGPFPDHFWRMEDIAAEIDADALFVCKPRLPSLDLGILAKTARNRPLLIDVDDRELTFVQANDGIALDDVAKQTTSSAVLNPYGRLWTRYCETLIPHADQVVVSNASLQQLYGGMLVPHARDEEIFDPARLDRAAARAHYGFALDERVVLFAGTPRPHKGIGQILAALSEIGDPRNKLCVIGTAEYEKMRRELAVFARWIHVLPYQRFDELPRLLAAADAVCVLQEPDDPVSHFQIPAKVTDALAMGVPCIATPVAPLTELIAAGGLLTTGEVPLAATLSTVLAEPDAVRDVAERGRAYFLDRLSYRAVLPPLSASIDELIERPRPVPPEFERLVRFQRDTFGEPPVAGRWPAPQGAPEPSPERLDGPPPHVVPGAAPTKARPVPRAAPLPPTGSYREPSYDVALFWKQNDTGVYGRRHDMLLRELVSSPRVGTVVQFDAPIDLATLSSRRRDDIPTQDALIHERLLPRLHGVEAAHGLVQYTFGYTADERDAWKERYVDYVRTAIAEQCSPRRELVFWVYPKNFEVPDLIQAIEPDLVLADIVDDHRTWAKPGSERWHMIDRHYADIAALSDVLVANCAPMAEMMSSFGKPVHVVPNGCEHPVHLPDRSVPPELLGLARPIVGYVGNLSSRLDIPLLERLAGEMPAASVVLIGSAHAGTGALALDRFDNVHIFGPRPYEEAKRFAAAFDVGTIPHVDNDMTRSMNPLKAYVYATLGVPTVSTRIANLDEMGDLITVAESHASFVDAVRRSARAGKLLRTPDQLLRLEANAWSRRLDDVLTLLDTASLASPTLVAAAHR